MPRAANDFPHSIQKKANDGDQLFAAGTSAGNDDITMSVDASNKISLIYEGQYASNVDDSKRYWIVFPTKTSDDVADDSTSVSASDANSPDSCTATFKHRSLKYYSRNLLVINANGNGPRYYYENSIDNEVALRKHFREGYTGQSSSGVNDEPPSKLWMNYRETLEFNNGNGNGNSLDDLVF